MQDFFARRYGVARLASGIATLTLVAACANGLPDPDLRDLGDGFDTSQAVANLPDRPRPDSRGVISYPNYQVVVAQSGDTIRSIAMRLGLDAAELARFNGIAPDVTLRRDELVALPGRVAEPSPATGAVRTGPIQPLDVTAIATTALDRAGPQQPVATAQAAAPQTPAAPQPQTGTEPIRHKVQRGETAFSISRLYDVPLPNIAEWNGLGPSLTIREGQFLLIPRPGAVRPPVTAPVTAQVTQPGAGSATPVPPSATLPLPTVAPAPAATPQAGVPVPPAPDIGLPEPTAQPATPPPSAARFAMPAQGNIIREYAPGRNEGIDIAVPTGTVVRAADSGTVAAVTTDTKGVAIVVVKHADNLLTVYTNLEDLDVAKGASVSRGGPLGKVRAGEPSFVHFEVRRGLQSVDPADFLP